MVTGQTNALKHLVLQGKIKDRDKIMLVGFGVGHFLGLRNCAMVPNKYGFYECLMNTMNRPIQSRL